MKLLLRTLSPAGHWRIFRLLLLLLFVARGAVYVSVMPPFAGCDEYQHVAYLVHLDERDDAPVLGEASVPRSLLRKLVAFPHPESGLSQMHGTTARSYADFWDADPRPTFREDHRDVRLYQAQHGSLYYRLVKPLFDAAGGIENLPRSVAALRLLNLACVAAGMWLVLGAAGRWIRGRAVVGLVALAVSWQPFFLGVACRVSNDAPGMLMATIVVVLVTGRWWPSSRWPVAWPIIVGLSIGLASLLKSVNLALVPFAAGWAIAVRPVGRGDVNEEPGPPLGSRIATAAAVVVLALAVVAPSMYENYRRFGTLTSMQEAVANRRDGQGATALWAAAGQVQWGVQFRDLWGRGSLWTGGWDKVYPPRLLRTVYLVVLVVAFLGGLIAIFRHRRSDRGAGVAVLLAASFMAALSVHMVHSQVQWGGVATDARYSAAALPWWVLGALAAASGWGRFGQAACACALVALFALAEVRGVVGEMVPIYSGLPFGEDALSRIASVQSPELGAATFWVAAAAVTVFGVLALSAAVVAVAVDRGDK